MSTAQEEKVLAGVPGRLLIGGEWVDASSGARFDVLDPATGAALASVADATPEDGIRALDAAVAVQDDWAATSPRTRSDLLRAAWEGVRRSADDLAPPLTPEMGQPLSDPVGGGTFRGEFLRRCPHG